MVYGLKENTLSGLSIFSSLKSERNYGNQSDEGLLLFSNIFDFFIS